MQMNLGEGNILIELEDTLIVPFGCPKWGIEKIKIVGVSTARTYIESTTPVAVIEKAQKLALRLLSFTSMVPETFELPSDADKPELAKLGLRLILDYLRGRCEVGTEAERRFLDLYFRECFATAQRYRKDDPDAVFWALLPLPQAHLYLSDPLDEWSAVPKRMVKVDFAFWTGTELVAVEIDGASHIGNADHIKKDRMLQRAEVTVIHILNEELMQHGREVLRLLPPSITEFWRTKDRAINPFTFFRD